MAISIVAEYLAAFVAAGSNVMPCGKVNDAQRSGHGDIMNQIQSRNNANVECGALTPLTF